MKEVERRMGPEDEVLLLLARGRLSSEGEERARRLARDVSWPLVIHIARLHGVHPLLERCLSGLGFLSMPEEVRLDLQASCRETAVRNILLARELVAVLRLLSAGGVPVMPLKGVALALSLHGDIALRVSTDLDILVPRASVAEAFDLLERRGYRPEFEDPFFRDRQVRDGIECLLTRREGRSVYPLELHWGVLFGAALDGGALEDLWAEARPSTFLGAPARAMSPEWNLLFLAAHAARHRWRGIRWLVDVEAALRAGGIDWKKVEEKAARFGWEEVLGITAGVSRALFGPGPSGLTLTKGVPRWVRLYPDDLYHRGGLGSLDDLRLLSGPWKKLRRALAALLAPTLAERRLVRLPRPLAFLYTPLRLLRLLRKLGPPGKPRDSHLVFVRKPGDCP